MIRRGWWWIGLLLLVGAVGGCDDHDHHHRDRRGCALFQEIEPNDTPRTADFLGEAFVGDCAMVEGSLFDARDDARDVDTYRFFVEESLSLVVTLDHSAEVTVALQLVDADTGQLIRDCGSTVVGPAVCVVPFVVRARDIAVDVVVTSVGGAGPYTLTLVTQ
jgi:hypothetical protein